MYQLLFYAYSLLCLLELKCKIKIQLKTTSLNLAEPHWGRGIILIMILMF